MSRAKRYLKIFVVCYLTAFVLHSVNRVLDQRDQVIRIEKFNSVVRAEEAKAQYGIREP